MTLPLLGRSHQDAVRVLLDSLSALQAGTNGAPRVVLLRGAQGDGKTRIIRELYMVLANDQPAPKYWPDLKRPSSNPLLDRKDLSPGPEGFVWTAGALPTFGWWAFTCSRDDAGRPSDSIAQADPELRAHLLPLGLARGQAIGLTGRARENFGDLIDYARAAVVDEGGMRALEAALKSFGFAVPGLGHVVSAVSKLTKVAAGKLHSSSELASDVSLGIFASTERFKLADTLAQNIGAVAHPAIPGILVVEDATSMGKSLHHALEIIGNLPPDKPVLTVMTAWPESEHEEPYRTLIADLEATENLCIIDVDGLSETDLKVLVKSLAPTATASDESKLAQAFPNPLMIQLYLGLPFMEAKIMAGSPLNVSDSDLAKVPKTIEGLYRARWDALPPEVRNALILASGASADGTSHEFLTEIVSEAAVNSGAAGVLRMVDVSASLQSSINPYGWCVSGGDVVKFNGRQLELIAAEAVSDALGGEYLARLRAEVGVSLLRWLDGDIAFSSSDPEVVAVSRWLTELEPAGTNFTHHMAAFVYAEVCAAAGQTEKARSLVRVNEFKQSLKPDDPFLAQVQTLAANMEMHLGRPENAAILIEEVIVNREALFEQSPWTIFMAITVHCRTLGMMDNSTASISGFRMLIDDIERITGAEGAAFVVAVRQLLAVTFFELEDYASALGEWEQILEYREANLGRTDPWTLEARSFVCTLPAYLDQPARSIELMGPLLDNLVAELGVEELLTFNVLEKYTELLWDAGQVDRGLQPFHLLLERRIATLKPTDRLIDDARNCLEACINDSQNLSHEQARTWYEEIARIDALLTGPASENALRMRAAAAVQQLEGGDRDGFAEICEELLPALCKALGDDDFTTRLVHDSLHDLG